MQGVSNKHCLMTFSLHLYSNWSKRQVFVGGGGTQIFSYKHTYFWLKILKFNIFWGFRKMNRFGGYEEIVDILGGSLHYWTNLGEGSFLYILGLFLKARYRMGIFFWVTKFQKLIWECLTFLIFLLGKQ